MVFASNRQIDEIWGGGTNANPIPRAVMAKPENPAVNSGPFP